jgi:quinohemoprotein ethanol dehydrogenase
MNRTTAGILTALGIAGALSITASAQDNDGLIDDRDLRRARATGEWLTHGGDYAETRFSTLDQINADNVSELEIAWTVEVGSEGGRQEATPLVHDGVLYSTTTWSTLFAVDLRTQALKWIWDPGAARGQQNGGVRFCCGAVNRGPAIYGDKIYTSVIDGRLAALDAETGRVEWVVKTTPDDSNYSITGAPRVVNGLVVIGNGGGDYGARGYATAYDAETGGQVWRFYVVPGNPADGFENEAMEIAAETWNGEWWEFGGGGTPWDSFAYDPVADLLYIGTGNGGPWSRDKRSPGGGDNLFLSSIVAVNASTGEYVWHYQTTPGDQWDFTAVQHLMLADLEIDGEQRQVIMQAPKNGFFYVLDRITGEFISAEAYSRLNWATGHDEDGRPIIAPEARYGERRVMIYPWARGGHNWHPMSFNPDLGLVYIPGQERGMTYQTDPNSSLGIVFGRGSGANTNDEPPIEPPSIGPLAPQGQPGFLSAWDPVEQKEAWRIHFDTIENSGTLATAGNLVFHGTQGGVFGAHDARTGELLWETRTLQTMGSPITYELDGVQYVSIMAGTQNNNPPGRVFTFSLGGE